jgi:hypothetical protein
MLPNTGPPSCTEPPYSKGRYLIAFVFPAFWSKCQRLFEISLGVVVAHVLDGDYCAFLYGKTVEIIVGFGLTEDFVAYGAIYSGCLFLNPIDIFQVF